MFLDFFRIILSEKVHKKNCKMLDSDLESANKFFVV